MKNKKKTLILTLIAVAVLIAAVVGATYAYFAVTIAGNQNASSIIAKSAQLGLIYTDGNEVNVENVIPGWATTKTFTVQNTGDAPIDYNIIWKELLNEIQNNDLVYSIIGTTTSLGETPVPLSAGPIITNIPINPGDTHEYTMTITFINRATEQNINQGKTFAGKIEINTEHMRDPATLILSEYYPEIATTTFLGSTIQRQQIEELEFVNHKNIPVNAIGSWDVSNTQDEQIMAWYEPVGSSGRYKVTIGTNGKIKANNNSSSLFAELINLNAINFNNNFDTSNTTNMEWLFKRCGMNSSSFMLDLSTFDTSNVTDMSTIFSETGLNNPNFTLNLNNFNTEKVLDMKYMFHKTGYNSETFTLDLGNEFYTSKTTDMQFMFNFTGYNSDVFVLNLGENFDTSNVTNMQWMFHSTGYSNPNFTLNLGNRFNTSKVTDMSLMFQNCGYSSSVFTLDLTNNFDTSNVEDTQNMFNGIGNANSNFILNLGGFNALVYTGNTNFMFNGLKTPSTIYTRNLTTKNFILENTNINKLPENIEIIDCSRSDIC